MTILIGFLSFLILLLLFSITLSIHEYAHGYVADRLGDPTPRINGRLSLNPLSHYDPIGSTLFLFGMLSSFFGFSFGPIVGWAKPVPIDPFNFRNPRRDSGLVALAGPAANLIMAFLVSLILRQFFIFDSGFIILNSFLRLFIQLNIGLAIFNLIPIGPLDGFKVVLGFLPRDLAYEWEQSEQIGMFLLLFLLFFPLPFFSLSSFLSIINSLILRLFLGPLFSSII